MLKVLLELLELNGIDGVTPSVGVSTSASSNGTTVTITINGEDTVFFVSNGVDGQNGADGQTVTVTTGLVSVTTNVTEASSIDINGDGDLLDSYDRVETFEVTYHNGVEESRVLVGTENTNIVNVDAPNNRPVIGQIQFNGTPNFNQSEVTIDPTSENISIVLGASDVEDGTNLTYELFVSGSRVDNTTSVDTNGFASLNFVVGSASDGYNLPVIIRVTDSEGLSTESTFTVRVRIPAAPAAPATTGTLSQIVIDFYNPDGHTPALFGGTTIEDKIGSSYEIVVGGTTGDTYIVVDDSARFGSENWLIYQKLT